MKHTVTAFEKSMQLLSDKYDTVLATVTQQEKDVKAVKERVEKLERNEVTEQIESIKKDVDELEWRNRKLNHEIRVQKTEHEDIRLKLNTLAASLVLPELKDSDVAAMHLYHQRQIKLQVYNYSLHPTISEGPVVRRTQAAKGGEIIHLH